MNRSKPDKWKSDTVESVYQYNDWLFGAAPEAYRQSTAPPLARDRLIRFSGAKKSLHKTIEERKLPARISRQELNTQLNLLLAVIHQLLDRDLIDWLTSPADPTERQSDLAAVVIGDRETGAIGDPVKCNAQERRQPKAIGDWLDARGYRMQTHPHTVPFTEMEPGTYSFRFTNTNERRNEEATKLSQIRRANPDAHLVLFLCGYFDSGYLGYFADDGLDWVWEHRVEDFEYAGL